MLTIAICVAWFSVGMTFVIALMSQRVRRSY